mmetsp:Transcript_41455/g.123852  ORF Transcript_41455/g.123852 Transcript_41455/m.123852 type:complete len:244 (+) Transcript_41455:276-1007(+)
MPASASPPSQPSTPQSHAQSTICCSLKLRMSPVDRYQAASIAPVAANDQQEPQYPWSLTPWSTGVPRQSTDFGRSWSSISLTNSAIGSRASGRVWSSCSRRAARRLGSPLARRHASGISTRSISSRSQSAYRPSCMVYERSGLALCAATRAADAAKRAARAPSSALSAAGAAPCAAHQCAYAPPPPPPATPRTRADGSIADSCAPSDPGTASARAGSASAQSSGRRKALPLVPLSNGAKDVKR